VVDEPLASVSRISDGEDKGQTSLTQPIPGRDRERTLDGAHDAQVKVQCLLSHATGA
jgi:hypothetical protein